jgi:mannose-1-phosphate guanylyltransferase / phosphomannomutase
VKAVVMAGGQGTRLRPLTSNQPKPMVPIANKPTVQHILELLARHGITDVVMTVAFMPQLLRNHFGDGSSLGMNIEYSVEESPLGTAGSVKNAEAALDEPFLVISGDALTDFDLTRIIDFHREREATVTIALKSVENPLEFGVVIVDEEGRIERFLEKPGWGQVFSDTINTGIYVMEPQVLDYVPRGAVYDFSHELFPKLFDMHKPLYGFLADSYWQDIGSVEQYLQANRDALDGKVKLQLPGMRLRGNVWVGQGVSLDSLDNVEGPAVIGNYARIDSRSFIGGHTVLGNNTVLKAGAQVAGSVLGDNCYLATGARVRGAVIGNSVDIRANAVVSEESAIGDQCSIGENAVIGNRVKIYPFKTIEAGTVLKTSLIWETRGTNALFGKSGVRGVVNVDITPEMAMRLAMSYGTMLNKDSFVTVSRDADRASRVLKRAMIAGLNATGVSVRDLEVSPPSVNRFDLKRGKATGGIHVRISHEQPDEAEILFFEPPGIPIDNKRERAIENYYNREDYRRAARDEIGSILVPPRAVETYLQSLLENWDTELIQHRALRVVLDYSFSAASLLLPSVIGKLGAEVMSINSSSSDVGQYTRAHDVPELLEKVSRLVSVMEADLGVLFDPSAERLIVVDERGERVADAALLLLLLRHVCDKEGPGAVAVPLNVTRHAEKVARGCGAVVTRTKNSNASLTAEAAQLKTIFAATGDAAYIFPAFLPSADALMSFGKVLEMLAAAEAPLSALVQEVPAAHVAHAVIACSWHVKGVAMRLMIEQLKGELEPDQVSLVDGIKITFPDDTWVQILPDADDPLFHVYAEADSDAETAELLASYSDRLQAVVDERLAEEG